MRFVLALTASIVVAPTSIAVLDVIRDWDRGVRIEYFAALFVASVPLVVFVFQPFYWLIRGVLGLNGPAWAIGAGAIVGGGPWTIWSLATSVGLSRTFDSPFGFWMSKFAFGCLQYGLAGALSGALFWFITRPDLASLGPAET